MGSRFLLLFVFLKCSFGLVAQDRQQQVFNIYFKSNSDIVDLQSMRQIRNHLLDIGTQNIREIKLNGHADSDAADSFNINLSNRRAANTLKYFMSQNVPETFISIGAFGESVPVSELKSLNRRVEITLVYSDENGIDDIKVKKFFIKGLITNFNTGKTLAADYAIKTNKRTLFRTAKVDGKFLLAANKGGNTELTFSKDGYLNVSLIIDDSYFKLAKGDTIQLIVKLKPVLVIEKIVYDHIFFYSDSDSLKPQSKPDLEKLFKILKTDNTMFIEIQGHMNCPLSKPITNDQKWYNQELSHYRAKAVYEYLKKRGIPPSQLTFKGMSNFNMIYPEPRNEQEADKNKRVEVWKLKVVEN